MTVHGCRSKYMHVHLFADFLYTSKGFVYWVYFINAVCILHEIGGYKPEISELTVLQKSEDMKGSTVCLLTNSISQNQRFHA